MAAMKALFLIAGKFLASLSVSMVLTNRGEERVLDWSFSLIISCDVT